MQINCWQYLIKKSTFFNLFFFILFCFVTKLFCANIIQPAIRVVRFRIDYPSADIEQVEKLKNWQNIMRKSILASLKFIDKHWLICGKIKQFDEKLNDCGNFEVTGENISLNHYRINVTFIANRDLVKNAKVEATSTLLNIIQIGLRGGIFQYINGMKSLGKPSSDLEFEDAYFCYPEFKLIEDKCEKSSPKH